MTFSLESINHRRCLIRIPLKLATAARGILDKLFRTQFDKYCVQWKKIMTATVGWQLIIAQFRASVSHYKEFMKQTLLMLLMKNKRSIPVRHQNHETSFNTGDPMKNTELQNKYGRWKSKIKHCTLNRVSLKNLIAKLN